MSDRNSTYFAITLSKFNRGSMTNEEIKQVVDVMGHTMFSTSEKLLIVNEHKNKQGQDFEHLHIFVQLKEPKRSDNITMTIKKYLTFLHHKKDVLTKVVYSDGWKEYISKSPDRNIVYKNGISDQELLDWETDYKAKVETVKEIKKIVKTRIFKSDLPYVMYNYIQEINFEYNFTLSDFTVILKDMLKNNYDFEIKGKMVETKAKLDLMFDSDVLIKQMLEDEFKFFGESNCEDYYVTSLNKLIKTKTT